MINKSEIKCPKCAKSNFWQTKDKRLKCKSCFYIFTLKPNPLNISNKILNETISEFLLEHSTNIILERVNVSKYKLLKTLTFLRVLMTKDIPENLKKIIKLETEKFEFNNKIRNPIIGIFCKEEKVYAKILLNIKPSDLKLFFKAQEDKKEPSIEEWQKYVGLVLGGRLYKLTISRNKKHRLDALETFWGYLKRKLSSKGGIRKEKLPLYLGEYAWRYNNRKLTLKEQEEKLLKLLIMS